MHEKRLSNISNDDQIIIELYQSSSSDDEGFDDPHRSSTLSDRELEVSINIYYHLYSGA